MVANSQCCPQWSLPPGIQAFFITFLIPTQGWLMGPKEYSGHDGGWLLRLCAGHFRLVLLAYSVWRSQLLCYEETHKQPDGRSSWWGTQASSLSINLPACWVSHLETSFFIPQMCLQLWPHLRPWARITQESYSQVSDPAQLWKILNIHDPTV